MPQQFIILIIAAAALLVIGGISFASKQGSLNSIKSKPVGDGQHGTARWATPKEIEKTFRHIPFRPTQWYRGWCWVPLGRRVRSPLWWTRTTSTA